MSLAHHHDPIAAVATAAGRAAVGIVRISGQGLLALAQAICARSLRPRQATYTAFLDQAGATIDRGLAIFFPAPHSFTGEDVLELQAHGGDVVLQLLLARCLALAAQVDPVTQRPRLAGLRLARPGEFSERAFLNDKIDLAQAEAIADLIDASTEAAARSAARSLSGAFSHEIQALHRALVQLRMLVEATLDFPEEDINFLHQADATGQLSKLIQAVQTVLQRARQGALLRQGIRVVIAGQPNVGKSSLLNALAQAELAIVTAHAGTTRDKVQQTVQIEGVPVHVIDTAGLRHSDDEVEQIGIAHSWQAIEQANVVLFLHDLTRLQSADYALAEQEIASQIAAQVPAAVPVIDIWNKVDAAAGCADALNLSAKTGTGLDALRRQLLQVAGWQAGAEGVFMARQRQLQALLRASGHLTRAGEHLSVGTAAIELVAEELRLAQNALGEITGEMTPEDLLGAIFSSFCIGK